MLQNLKLMMHAFIKVCVKVYPISEHLTKQLIYSKQKYEKQW